MRQKIPLVVGLVICFNSCSNVDDFKSSSEIPSELVSINSVSAKYSDLFLYKTVFANFEYSPNKSVTENLQSFQLNANNVLIDLGVQTTAVHYYNTQTLADLQNIDDSYIDKMNYSPLVKIYMRQIGTVRFSLVEINNSTALQQEEKVFLDTFFQVYSDEDDIIPARSKKHSNRNRRAIAFAYGAETSITIAILNVGAMDLIDN